MKKLSERLSEFISDPKFLDASNNLSRKERRIYRSLQSMGERAIKGRDITSYLYETRMRGEEVNLLMLLEGRHAMSVGNQVKRIFEGHSELEFVSVVETKRGAKVILKPRSSE